jgi:hypothetical protein
MAQQHDERAFAPGDVFVAFLRAHGASAPLDREAPPQSAAKSRRSGRPRASA